MHHRVPAYSQHLDVHDVRWQPRACGIVSLKAVIDYWQNTTLRNRPTIAQLIKEGLKKDGYIPGVGWKHKTLAKLAAHHGLRGRHFDWHELSPENALEKLLVYFAKGPIIASIHKNFRLKGSGHLVVIKGIDTKRIFYNDPDARTKSAISRSVTLSRFLRGWKRRVIAVTPRVFAPARKKK